MIHPSDAANLLHHLATAVVVLDANLTVLHDNLGDMKDVPNNLIYQKGGWTLHMLRGTRPEMVFRSVAGAQRATRCSRAHGATTPRRGGLSSTSPRELASA